MATITDVAREAGVSISTVSNVINGTKFVGEELTERVNRAIETLGYQANELAASMKRRTTNNIGVILPNIGMVFFPDVLKGIEAAAKEHGYKIFYFSTDYDFEKEKEYLNLLKTSWVDGIIIDSCCPTGEVSTYQESLAANVAGRNVPVVTLETPFNHKNLGVITLNEVKFTDEAIEYLISLGHREIGILLGPENIPMYSNNIKGIEAALERHGMELLRENIMIGDYFAESGYTAVKKALDSGAQWSAIFSANDQMAIGAIKAIKEANLSIPDDVSVIGVDGIYVTTLIDPPLTTVELPRFDMGYRAGNLLMEMIQGRSRYGEHIEMEGKMIIRKSTEKAAREDWVLTGW
ncbi:MAG: LacI family DNA-binding transcriptional regulator [Oscillospiraceae bacterium]|nr:LacI family DNA-binding transcriptional regulator [Oscillospiraceae bacterium]MBQ6697946.1 LacI family DNA-binding transcriptional regulator [Oscillospiraceae bacterium]